MRYRSVLAIVIVLAVIIALPLRFADEIIGYGPPVPDSYMEKGGPDSRNRDVSCPHITFKNGGPQWIWPGAGGDTVILGRGSGVRMFDSASSQTGTDHDTIVLENVRPGDVRAMREGAHLLLCGKTIPLSITLYRQYCRGVSDGTAWNNQFEEIVFPDAAEIWLADEVLESAPDRSDIAALTRINGLKDRTFNLKDWHIRPFSAVLPSGWLSSLACRRDPVQPAPADEQAGDQ